MTAPDLAFPIHPAQVLAGPARIAAIEKWCAAGWDPHVGPDGKRFRPDQVPQEEDQSVWALALSEGSGVADGAASALQAALKAGAELQRPVGVPGGWITPLMAILRGPLEEARLKLRLLKKTGPLHLEGRWPTEGPHQDAAPLHLLIQAQPGPTADVRPAVAEQMITEMIEDIMGTGQGVATTLLLRDRTGAIALHAALRLGRYEVALRLLQVATGEQAIALDHAGNGAFHALVQAGWNPAAQAALMKVARTLGSHGAQWHTPNQAGLSALDLALRQAQGPEEEQAWHSLAQRSTAALM